MPVYDAASIPDEATRTTLPDDLATWPKEAPRLGEHAPVHVQRVAHDKLVPRNPPPIGRVEQLGPAWPHGTLPVRCYHPSRAGGRGGAGLPPRRRMDGGHLPCSKRFRARC